MFQQEEPDFVPWAIPVRILYEDELILAVSKPAGMIVHPDDKGKTGTLANAVAAYYLRTGQHCTVRPIHRLEDVYKRQNYRWRRRPSRCPYLPAAVWKSAKRCRGWKP